MILNGLGTILGKGRREMVGRLIGRVTGVKHGRAILGAAVALAVASIVTVGEPSAAAAANTYPNTSSIAIKRPTPVQKLTALLAGPNHHSLVLFAGVGLPFSVPAPPRLSVTPNDAGTTQYSIDGGVAQTITFTSTAPTSANVSGPTYTAAATASSGLPVTLTIDSASTSVCSIDNTGVVSFTGAGTCTIDANQAGDTNYTAAAQVQQTVTVSLNSQRIDITSSTPAQPVVGGSYTPTATTTSGLPVVFSIDASSTPGACSISSGVVSFIGSGTCLIDANQAGNGAYAPAPQVQQPITIEALNSDTALVVSSTGLTATVSGNGPTPTGSVTFSVNGNAVGTVQLSQGVATLSYSFAPGQAYDVTVQYSGDKAYTESSATSTYTAPSNTVTTPPPSGTNTPPPSATNTTPTSPPPAPKRKLAPLKITLKLSSSRPEQHGWWTAPVTVTFTCTRAGRRVAKCPRPVRLDKSGNHVVNGHKIHIDLGKPSLRIIGLNAGATYLVSTPAPRCHAQDAISGIRSCSISQKIVGRATGEQTMRFTAKAVSGAGIVARRSVTVSEQQLGLIGLVSSSSGIYAVNTGRTYTLEVASRTKPLYVEGAVAPQRPVGAHNWFVLNGHSDGIPLWELSVLLPSGLPQDAYWNIGVQIGSTIRIFAIRD